MSKAEWVRFLTDAFVMKVTAIDSLFPCVFLLFEVIGVLRGCCDGNLVSIGSFRS